MLIFRDQCNIKRLLVNNKTILKCHKSSYRDKNNMSKYMIRFKNIRKNSNTFRLLVAGKLRDINNYSVAN